MLIIFSQELLSSRQSEINELTKEVLILITEGETDLFRNYLSKCVNLD